MGGGKKPPRPKKTSFQKAVNQRLKTNKELLLKKKK